MPRGFRIKLDRGINFSEPPSMLEPGELSIARNCHYFPESSQLAKVGGRVLFGSMGAPASGLSYGRFKNAGAFLVGSAGTDYYSSPLPGVGTFTSIASGLSPVGRMEAAYYHLNDRLYIADGVNRLRDWTGSGSSRVVGITQPSGGTGAFLNNSGTIYPNGTTYQYCCTAYDSVNDDQSPPSAVIVLAASAANGTFKFTFPAAVPAGADRWRLWRTQSGQNVFYLLAEVATTILRYYDGTDSEGLGNASTNSVVWGFATVDDQFLSTRPVLPMVGEPLKSNYITVNGDIPIGDIMGFFTERLYITGVPSFPHDVYFALPGHPGQFSPVNFFPIGNELGEPVTAAGVANDRFIAFTRNTAWRLNAFPDVTDPGFALGQSRRELITSDAGAVAKRAVVNFGLGQPNNRLFYVSERGPMQSDAYFTYPLGEDLNWGPDVVNMAAVSRCVAKNFPKYSQIRLFCPSPGSQVNDQCFVYHYHPNLLKHEGGVGCWTGPIHVRCAAAAVSFDKDTEARMFVADTDASGSVYQEDEGFSDGQAYDATDGSIDWEWMTGDQPFNEESATRRVTRVFLNTIGTDAFSPELRVAVNKADQEHVIPLSNLSDNSAGYKKLGTSLVQTRKTRSHRGGVWAAASHIRFHMQEKAKGDRQVASLEVEIEPFGRQR